MHQSLKYLKILDGSNLDILLRTWDDVHLPASNFRHKSTRGNGVGDTTSSGILMSGDKIAQTECLRCLRADEFIAGNACSGGETVLTLKDCLAAFDASYGIAVFLTDGNVG